MKQLVRLVFTLPLCLSATLTSAEVISIQASADSIINANSPGVVSSATTDLVATKFGNSGEVSSDLRIFYAQFQLPEGLTGQDMTGVNDAQLEITRTVAANHRLNYYIYGVLDGVDTASADTYSWNSGVGIDPANNQVRFLTPDEINYYRDPAEAVFVGNIRTANDEGPYAPPNQIDIHGPFDFTVEAQSPTAVANLRELILNDTDGRLTFYGVARAPFEVHASNTFAALEHETFAPPTLVLDFVVPEPHAFLLCAVGLMAVTLAGRRQP